MKKRVARYLPFDPKALFGLLFVGLVLGANYLLNQVNSIYGGDGGDFAVAILTRGIAHPPGYPLYTSLGIDLVSLLPLKSVAYRIGFLSAVSQTLAIIFLFLLIFFVSKNVLVSVISVLTVSFTYPIFLYAEVVEVFALFNLFFVALLLIGYLLARKKKRKYLYLLFFVLGLSFSHHHIIIFLLPAILYIWRKARLLLSFKVKFTCLLLFISGLAPYLYFPLSSSFYPAINWQGEANLVNFFRLVTRADYGTFVAGRFATTSLQVKLYDLLAVFDFLYQDFRFLGIILSLMGLVYLSFFNRQFFWYVTISFLSFLFFLFYSSFPLFTDFNLATYERFVQPLYFLTSIYFAYGLLFLQKILDQLLFKVKILRYNFRKSSIYLIPFLILPFSIFWQNYPKISILKNDFTPENLAYDLLDSVPDNSILVLASDTALFNSQYVYYLQNKWSKVKLIQYGKLGLPYYQKQLEKLYPDLTFRDDKIYQDNFDKLVRLNFDKFPIFSERNFYVDFGYWLPYGLLYRFQPKEVQDNPQQTINVNNDLFTDYQDPLANSLVKYKNLMLSDILRIYGSSHQEFAFYAAEHNYYQEAEQHFLEAIRLYPVDGDSFALLAQVYIRQKKCGEADQQIVMLEKIAGTNPNVALIKSFYQLECLKDSESNSEYNQKYKDTVGYTKISME